MTYIADNQLFTPPTSKYRAKLGRLASEFSGFSGFKDFQNHYLRSQPQRDPKASASEPQHINT